VAALSIARGSGSSFAMVVILLVVFIVVKALPLLSLRPRPTMAAMLTAISSTSAATLVAAVAPLCGRMVATVSTVDGGTRRLLHDI